MKIYGRCQDISQILVKHRGTSFNFECFFTPFPYAERRNLEEPKVGTIEIDDLQELNSLISTLQQVRDKMQAGIGEYRCTAVTQERGAKSESR